jgi:hypothetical protein
MKIAVMQPYLFPYIGYFHLIDAADKFIFYDDVNFIKQGWINRNYILSDNKGFLFSVPVKDISSFRLINEVEINEKIFPHWKKKFLKTLELSYSKAPCFQPVFEMVQSVFDTAHTHVSKMAAQSIAEVCNFLGIETVVVASSSGYSNAHLKGKVRVLDICKKENATTYFNASGGQELYDKEEFSSEGIDLKFVKPLGKNYTQFNGEFVPWLSIIDVLMFNNVDECKVLLKNYELQ